MTATPTPTGARPEMRWTPTRTSRIGCCIASLFFLFMGVLGAVSNQFALTAIGLVSTAVCLRVITFSSLVLTPDTVEIRNLLSTRAVALTELSAVTPSYSGIVIDTRDGASYTALAVQKANLSAWLGRRTRADEVANAVRQAAGLSVVGGHSHGARPGPTPEPSELAAQ